MLLTVSLCWYMPTYIKLIVAKFRHLIVLLFSNITESNRLGTLDMCAVLLHGVTSSFSCHVTRFDWVSNTVNMLHHLEIRSLAYFHRDTRMVLSKNRPENNL